MNPSRWSIRVQMTLAGAAIVLPIMLYWSVQLFLVVDKRAGDAAEDNRLMAELVAASLSQGMQNNAVPVDALARRLISERKLPAQKFIMVVDSQGTIVTHSSDLGKWVEGNLKSNGLVDISMREPNGTARWLSEAGVDTIIGFAKVPESGWHVIVGARADQVLAVGGAEIRNTGIVFLILCLFVFLIAYWYAGRISRPLLRLAETTRKIAAGQTKERAALAGPREVVTLARDFNQMLDERTRYETALHESERRFRDVANVSADWIWEVDASGLYTYASDSVTNLLGYAPEQLIGRSPFDFMPAAPGAEQVRKAFGEIVSRGETFHDLENVVRDSQGDLHHTLTSGTPIHDPSGQIVGYRGVDRDVTAHKMVLQELERLAQTDGLTELTSRRHFMLLAEQELSRIVRYGGELSMLMLDIDHFKHVNDTYGHHTGDLVLQKLSGICREALRDVDVIGRLGGEEFAIAMPQTGRQQATEAAERLRKAIETSALPLEQGQPLKITVSIGVATLTDPATNLDTLLGFADKALYDAKQGGRNRVCIYDAA